MTQEERDLLMRLKYDVSILQGNWNSEKDNRDRVYERMAIIEKTLARIDERLAERRWSFQAIIQTIMTAATMLSALIMIWK